MAYAQENLPATAVDLQIVGCSFHRKWTRKDYQEHLEVADQDFPAVVYGYFGSSSRVCWPVGCGGPSVVAVCPVVYSKDLEQEEGLRIVSRLLNHYTTTHTVCFSDSTFYSLQH